MDKNLPPQEREILSVAEVLEIIAPLDPENLQHLGRGVYEARWIDDAEGRDGLKALRQMARVTALTPAYHPGGLKTWIAIQFCIRPLPLLTIESVQ